MFSSWCAGLRCRTAALRRAKIETFLAVLGVRRLPGGDRPPGWIVISAVPGPPPRCNGGPCARGWVASPRTERAVATALAMQEHGAEPDLLDRLAADPRLTWDEVLWRPLADRRHCRCR